MNARSVTCGRIGENLECHDKDFGVYSKVSGEPIKVYE